MRRWLSLAVGVVIGQWLAFGGLEPPARVQTMGMAASRWEDHLRATALARLGTTVTLESARGVWTAPVTLNGRPARFLVDTGASVIVLSPALAERVGVRATSDAGRVEMATIAGPAGGPTATIDSIEVGEVELRAVPAVIHEPGLGVDGILGNSVLGRFTMTLDPERGVLHLRPFARP